MKTLIDMARSAIYESDSDKAVKVAKLTIEQGLDPAKIIDQGLTPGMIKIVELFLMEKTALPSLLMSVEAMNNALKILEPYLQGKKTQTVILGKRGYFFSQRVLEHLEPLRRSLHHMEYTRHTWPALLWEVPLVIRAWFLEPEKNSYYR